MKITEIKLRNFKPFYGEVTLQPTTKQGKPIVLMQGKNDTGKTSFHSAFRFCLYGPRDNKEKHGLINRQAVTEGNGIASVTLSFEHGDQIFHVERGVEFSQVDSADDRQANNEYRMVTTANGDTVVGKSAGRQEYRRFVNRIIPENVADFFFFDAEDLNRFEESNDEEIREAIETVLGIQEIENSISDLQSKKDDYRREHAKIESTVTQQNERKNRVEEIDERIDEIEGKDGNGGKLAEIESQIETKRSTLESVKERLADISDTAEKREKVEELKTKVAAKKEALAEKSEAQREIRKFAGPLIGQNAAEVILQDYDVDGVSGEADVINNLLDRDECLCGEELTSKHREHLMERWQRLQSEETRQLSELQSICNKSDINVDHKVSEYRSIEQDTVRLEQDIEEGEADKAELEEEIKSIEENAEAKLTDRKNELKREIEVLEGKKDNLIKELGKIEDEQNRLWKRVKSQEGASREEQEYEQLVGVADRCRQAMSDVKEELIERRREEVEEYTSQTFLELTNRPDHYKGISITENYELRVRTEGSTRTIAEQAPSEGQKQIIAYSFIAGLSKYTTRNAPVVIDTPIGRLDREHKQNLIEHYHQFSNQVMILYQPNEMEESDIQDLSEKMSKHFLIQLNDDVDDASEIIELPELIIDPAEEI